MAEKNIPDLDALGRNLADGDLFEVFATAEAENRKVPAPDVRKLRYGSIEADANAVTTALSVLDTFAQVLQFDTDGVSNDTTPDHASDHILIDHTGAYLVSLHGSFTGTVSETYEVAVHKNNGAARLANLVARRLLNAGGDLSAFAVSAPVALAAGDTVEVWVKNVDSAGDPTFENIVLSVLQIG